ncbi:protease inhibitor I42 family protein [Chloroflexota bacterium]
MKLKIILILAAVTTLLSLFACSQASQISLEIPYEDFTRDQHFTWAANTDIGDTIIVKVGSNPTTGFTWPDIVQISNQDIVRQTDHKFVSPGQTAVPGASGKDVWTFKALKTGTTTISMGYSKPWEGGEKSEWTFIATIIVK